MTTRQTMTVPAALRSGTIRNAPVADATTAKGSQRFLPLQPDGAIECACDDCARMLDGAVIGAYPLTARVKRSTVFSRVDSYGWHCVHCNCKASDGEIIRALAIEVCDNTGPSLGRTDAHGAPLYSLLDGDYAVNVIVDSDVAGMTITNVRIADRLDTDAYLAHLYIDRVAQRVYIDNDMTDGEPHTRDTVAMLPSFHLETHYTTLSHTLVTVDMLRAVSDCLPSVMLAARKVS